MSFVSSIGNWASRFAGKSGFLGGLARGIGKAAGLVTKYAPKVINVAKNIYGGLKTGLGFLQKTGIMSKIDKKGNFTNAMSKVGLMSTNTTKSDNSQNTQVGNNVG